MRTLDRYVIREMIPPFLIALVVFTFVLIIPWVMDLAEQLIAKGVAWTTIVQLMTDLLPSALGLTIPMALLVSILVAFGRLSGDREVVVMMACGISPYRLLAPVLAVAVVCWGATSWVLIKALPDWNQHAREITLRIVADRAEGEVKPRVFFEDFPGTVLYVGDLKRDGTGWEDVFAADTSKPAQPVIYAARRGRMIVDRQARTIQMVLQDGTRHATKAGDPTTYEVLRFESTVVLLNPETVFPTEGPPRGEREMTIAELRARIAQQKQAGESPHNAVMEIQKKFSIPVACLVFAVLGVALGLTSSRDGRLASFVLGLGVIFAYYVVMFTAEALAKGHWVPAWIAMWLPDVVLGVAGVALLVWRTRSADQPIRIALPWMGGEAAGSSGSAGSPGSAQAARRGRAIVLRAPAFDLPRPRLLDLYVARQYLLVLALATAGLLGLFYLSTFIDLSDKLFKGQASLEMLVEFLAWSTPQFVVYVLALGVLLSALVTIGLLTKNSELIVMRACGISLYRTAAPLLVFGVAGSLLLAGLQEHVLAVSNRQAQRLNRLIRYGPEQTFDASNRQWLVGKSGDMYHYQHFDPRRQELVGLSIFHFDPETRALSDRIYATKAAWAPDSWKLEQGWSRHFASGSEVTAFDRFDGRFVILEPPDYFAAEAPDPDRMTFAELRRHIEELRASGYDALEHEVGLHRKVAFPVVTLVMTLIAVPFAVTTGRRGAMYGVGVGIVLALLYWTLISVFAAFGAAGTIPPALAAWAPNLVFGAAAAFLLLTVRT
jgi:LPS export ABC transporter permease LptG/LPS export ABC transporter permease LptF